MIAVKKIPSSQYDSLRDFILGTEGKEVEMIVYGRHGERPISVDLVGSPGISGLIADALAEAVKRHFEGQSERVRLRTQFSLVAYRDMAGIFLEYRMEDHLLELERATMEVPRHIMGFVQFLECMEDAEVEFRFGNNRSDPFGSAEFGLSQHVAFAGCGFVNKASLKSKPSLDFVIGVGGEYLKRIVNEEPSATHVVNLVLEEEEDVVYFRLYHKGQRFFSVERDKLRSKK